MIRRILGIVVLVLAVDQLAKYLVRSSMYLGESVPVIGEWLRLTYTENPGIAFGITMGPRIFVPLVSIIATLLIIGYLWYSRNSGKLYTYSIALVLGGALGNIIDRVFYGKLYGYGDLFQGRVVDFIHIDLWQGVVADWVPFLGGKYVALFPVWNIADMAIVIGMTSVLFLQYQIQERQKKEEEVTSTTVSVVGDPSEASTESIS